VAIGLATLDGRAVRVKREAALRNASRARSASAHGRSRYVQGEPTWMHPGPQHA